MLNHARTNFFFFVLAGLARGVTRTDCSVPKDKDLEVRTYGDA